MIFTLSGDLIWTLTWMNPDMAMGPVFVTQPIDEKILRSPLSLITAVMSQQNIARTASSKCQVKLNQIVKSSMLSSEPLNHALPNE